MKELTGIVGESINITCEFNSQDGCGDLLHNIKWYKNEERIYSYSPKYGYNEALGRFQPDRAVFLANDTPPALQISPVQLTDYGIYRCDVTYISLRPECPVSTSTELKIKGKS